MSGERIPRTRGDGPEPARGHGRRARDSPHPRGWTLHAPVLHAPVLGFPAPAGMDPPSCRLRRSAPRIPRTRGDGPGWDTAVENIVPDSPHPRGWTRVGLAGRCGEGGFPAPAGMDPAPRDGRGRRRRIPRTRGDGPCWAMQAWHSPADSPHPRGWTLRRVSGGLHRRGFPAPAGMDPGTPPAADVGPWIPRTRGDGPESDEEAMAAIEDSPHPRGWTRVGLVGRRGEVGFPAPAGMDPGSGASGECPPRIPRTRGDGPRPSVSVSASFRDSPHPRGWTPADDGRLGFALGFPAPAGMDRHGDFRHAPPPRIPRTRGDGPAAQETPDGVIQDSPHPRGWTRR